LGEIPKNYPDIIAENYNIDVVNYGMGGCSNYTIFESFINNHKNMNLTKVVEPPINTNIPKQIPMLSRDEFMKIPKIITTYGMIGQLQNTTSCSSCGK
jgi:hypothetical protein